MATEDASKKNQIKKLKMKVEKYKKENEFLKKNLMETTKLIDKIKDIVKEAEGLYNEVMSTVKNIKSQKDSNSTLETNHDSPLDNLKSNKLDEESKELLRSGSLHRSSGLDISFTQINSKYNTLKKSYEDLVSDYKKAEVKISEQNQCIDELNYRLDDQSLHDKCNKKIAELREINQSIINSCISCYNINNNFMSNQYSSSFSALSSSNKDDKAEAFNEPVPSMLNFLAKYS